jgi:hypothetical protein
LEEEQMMRQVVDYLFKIAINRQVYYYRYSEATSRYDVNQRGKTPIYITVDDLFREEYEPSLSGNIDIRYAIAR